MVKHTREVAEKITRMEWFFFLFVFGKKKKMPFQDCFINMQYVQTHMHRTPSHVCVSYLDTALCGWAGTRVRMDRQNKN